MKTSQITFPPLSYVGWESSHKLIEVVAHFKANKILLITDPVLVEIGLSARIAKLIPEQQLTIYSDIEPEPFLACGEALVNYTRDFAPDLIIGLGGGSALDLAKLAAVLAAHEGQVADYLNLTGSKSLLTRGIPRVLLPTTSGTGSEVTNISVLSLEKTKDVVAHNFLMADVAIVDPALTLTVPPSVTAATGIDALVHAVEAYISVNASPTSDALALQAMRLIAASLPTAVQEGTNEAARSAMSQGSYLAGLAFFNAGVAGVHALAYPLGGRFKLAHGEANAVLLPYVMAYIRSSCTKRMADILNALGGNSQFLSEEEASRQCVKKLAELVAAVNLPASLQAFNIPASALEMLSEDATKQTRLLGRSPMPLALADIRKIYEATYEGVLPKS